ncbi:DnaT-like ssDNA-binding protein [Ruegeria sp.]|uniref:DnaT-like ssDNA-binding protein n=1 Tax=Ruegeria sp. TaxID=1879320 RepID=UPI003B58E025
MALDVTISGTTSDSYGDLNAIKARWDAVGYDYTGKTDTEIEKAARRATDWLEGQYRPRFPGNPADTDQRLHWPASGATDFYGNAIDDASIPVAVFHAQCEAAYRELTVPNSLTPDYVRAKVSNLKSAKAGPASVSYETGALKGDVSDLQPLLTSVENILSRIISHPIGFGVV